MDHNRMRAYHSAIMNNRKMFEGKVVLDVGAGSGVLSIWAAQAGAAKVYGIEFTDIAKHARVLVEANGVSDIVEIIQSSAEDIQLPCKVDIIISEWMGYILLRESMLDSVIRARNKWLKPDGAMFPSHATMFLGAISYEEDRIAKVGEYAASMHDWAQFTDEMTKFYNINMSPLDTHFDREQAQYYIYSGLWTELRPEHLIGQPAVIKRLDLNTCTIADALGVDKTPYSITVPFPSTVSGFAGWFTVDFAGSVANPCQKRVTLSTGPEAGYTHWGQQVFYMQNAITAAPDTVLAGEVAMVRQDENKRLYNLDISISVNGGDKNQYKYEIP